MRFWTAVLILIAQVVGMSSGHSHDIPGLPGVQYPRVVVLSVTVNQPRARTSRREETAGIGEI